MIETIKAIRLNTISNEPEWMCVQALWPDGFWWLRQSRQELPGGRTPHGHHLLKADGQQGTVGWEAAALGHQAVIGSHEITRPGRTFVCWQERGRQTQRVGLVRNFARRPTCCVVKPKRWRLARTDWLIQSDVSMDKNLQFNKAV